MMANGHGGARTPQNPAPVSGPGQLSQRTDGGPTQGARYVSGGAYGQGQAMMDLQRSAPMAASGAQTQGQMPSPQPSAAPPVPLDAPTQRPDEPLTAGNPRGPGPGPEVLTDNTPKGQSRAELKAFQKYLPALMEQANAPDAPASFVKFVRYLRDA
jgi:hypothetical protein